MQELVVRLKYGGTGSEVKIRRNRLRGKNTQERVAR